MTAVSGVLMLRHIMAEMSPKLESVPALQQVMNVAVFRANMKETPPEDKMFRIVADTLLGLVMLKDNSVPKDSFAVQDLLPVVVEVLDAIIANVSTKPPAKVPPVAYTVQDLIETCFAGADYDPRDRISAYYFGE
jgi:hypothetical protein